MSTSLSLERVFDGLRDRLLRLAGYENPVDGYMFGKENARVHLEFKRILSVLEEIAGRKVDGYGSFRYTEMEQDWRWEIQSMYQDVERKFGRLKTMVRPNPVGAEGADLLLEILSDLAVYSARGIQIIARLEALRAAEGKQS